MSDVTIDSTESRRRDWTSEESRRRVKRRYAADRRLQLYGLAAIAFAVILLGVLIASLMQTGYQAFVQSKVILEVYINPEHVKADDIRAGNFRLIARESFARLFPDVTNRRDQSSLQKLLTSDAPYIVQSYVLNHPDSIGQTVILPISLSDPFDQLHKGVIPAYLDALHASRIRDFQKLQQRGVVFVEGGKTGLEIDVHIDPARVGAADPDYRAIVEEGIAAYFSRNRGREYLDILGDGAADAVKAFVEANPGEVGKTVRIRVPLSEHYQTLSKGQTPQIVNPRMGSEKEVMWYRSLVDRGLVHTVFASELFFNADSRFPERAGLAGAIAGSFFALLVCFLLSFPIGIAAAVYLEEFAPKNRLTDLIEVNINNLAAVPSVVFGLLGLAVFIGAFGLPRSAPLVGGMVLSLMTLPTIIITTRAALKAVPPSIREAALGVGASKHQVMLHHVLPLAMPGILTGTIIGLAQALGETAPLLLVGMNAFIPSIESFGMLEPATALPTQIFSWADSPERGFVARTSAAILVLLGFLIVMNAIAIFLRQKFERKW
ncbi:MAG: phosphate ABC transporter permease PstA [Pseudomonadota bacterium]|nr:phosphate ABC transporter permease PstA [Pseudomonadota bacterium]